MVISSVFTAVDYGWLVTLAWIGLAVAFGGSILTVVLSLNSYRLLKSYRLFNPLLPIAKRFFILQLIGGEATYFALGCLCLVVLIGVVSPITVVLSLLSGGSFLLSLYVSRRCNRLMEESIRVTSETPASLQ